jgi:hypothetical protein
MSILPIVTGAEFRMSWPKEATMDRKWTVMVYLAGDSKNNLSAEMIFALKQMKEVSVIGEDKDIAVVVLFDPCGEKYPTEVYLINRIGSKSLSDDQITGTGIDADKTNIKNSVISFTKWAIENYQAEHYMLVLSGHCSGAEGDYLLPDQNPPSALRTDDLTIIVREISKQLNAKRLDILGLDSCLTSMVETCHALCHVTDDECINYVDYLIGAEGYTPLTGWPYKEIFQAMASIVASSKADASLEISTMVVRQYAEYYRDYVKADICVDLAAIALQNYGMLAKEIKALANHFLDEFKKNTWLVRELIQLAHLKVQSYLNGSYADLRDFCYCLNGLCYEKTKSYCKNIETIANDMVKDHKSWGDAVVNSKGLAICLPWTNVTKQYKSLKFSGYTQWDNFLNEYLSGSSRIKGRDPAQIRPLNRGVGETKPSPLRFIISEDGVRPDSER